MLKILLLFLLICTFVFFQCGDKRSPLFVYILLWTIIILLYELHLFTIFDIHDNTKLMLCVSILCYIIGGVIFNNFGTHSTLLCDKCDIAVENSRIRILVLLLFVSSISYYYQLIRSLINNGWQSQVNKILLTTGEIDSGGPLLQFFVRPFEFIIVPISTYYLINKCEDKLVAFSGLYFALLKFICTGSKSIVIYYIISFAISYLHYYNHKKKKNIKIFLFSIIGGVTFLASAGVAVRSLYFYICGCIPMLDKVINNPFYFDGKYTYGFLSFNSVARLVINTLKIFDPAYSELSIYAQANSAIQRFEYTTQVSDYGNYNAFTTYISNFYIDGGMLGVIVLSFGFGALSSIIYNNFKKTKSICNFCQLMLIYYFIMFSGVRFQLSNTIVGCAFIYSLIFGKYITGEYSKSKSNQKN